ncbi:MAG: insulinase family protein [Verrucomicrobia bacterium]|nr:insulinase family protein [Verrucomicrobiota bacterium]
MKFQSGVFFLSLLLLANAPAMEGAQSYERIEDKATLPILNPILSGRAVEKLVLKNHLEVYLISDPGVDQSAAGVAVESGSWEDPAEYPGMAHFLEHMLFMGTGAFPKEFEYMQFITDHGGKVNAFTAPDRTVYMFSINNDAFEDALDRFSHFFIDPLLSTNCINRELHAVDQEHSKNIEHDGWRQYMILKETGNPHHPNSAFSTGNAQTLSGIPQSALKDWYESHYSANAMHLVMISPLSVEEMRDLAIEYFSSVPEFTVAKKALPTEITCDRQKGHMIFIKPVKEIKQLSLTWEVPAPFAENIDCNAPDLVAYALNQEGKGSLSELLKEKKIAESVRVSSDRLSKSTLLFSVDISLTDQGLTELDAAVTHVFEAIARLKKEGYPSYLFDEMHKMAKLNYQFQSRDDAFETVMTVAGDLPYEDLATFPEKLSIPNTFDPALIQSFIGTLKAESCLYFVLADPLKTGVPTDRKEKWMQADYAIKTIASSKLTAWNHVLPNPAIQLPTQNPYIPSDLALASVPADVHSDQSPLLLFTDSGSRIYYAQDTRYQVPEISHRFSLKSPLIENTAKAQVLVDLYLRALAEKLSAPLSLAGSAGLSTAMSSKIYSIEFGINGYSDKAPLLLKELFSSLKAVNPSQEEFEIYRVSIAAEYDNASKELPVRQAIQQIDNILLNTPGPDERLKAIQQVSYEEFARFSKQLCQTAYVEGLLYGNLSEMEAHDLWGSLREELAAQPYRIADQYKKQILILSEKYGPYKLTERTDRQGSGVVLLLQEGSFSFENRAVQQILGAALSDGFFDTLRTKQQTAYFAKAWAAEEERQLLQYFAVQSSTHAPTDLLARFELFLESFDKNLTTQIPEGRFESLRANLITLLKMPPENMPGMASLLNKLAFDYSDFSWIDRRIEGLKKLTYEQFCQASHQILSRSNPRRLALLMEGVITPENDFHYETISREDVHNVGTFVSVR